MKDSGFLTDIAGIRVGNTTDSAGLTGCTVVICDAPMTGGVDVRGSATGTREIELLRPTHLVQHVHAIFLSGGSAYGLDAASGVMRYLEENDRGFDVKVAKVPIVPAAILFDLGIGDPSARPDAQMGYKACKEAVSGSFKRGNAGAGTGATVGKILGIGRAMKGGLGTACVHMAGGIKVGALVAVNAFGDVVDPSIGAIVAGARNSDDTGFADTAAILRDGRAGAIFGLTSTVIGIVATNARLTKEETNKLAQMAANGIARTILPAHTSYDGDVVFALSRADSASTTNVSAIGSAAAEALADAILDAITCAESVEGIPAAHDVKF